MNLLLIIVYLISVTASVAFAVYVIHRAWQMRLAGDSTKLAITVFSVALFLIVLMSLIIMLTIGWEG